MTAIWRPFAGASLTSIQSRGDFICRIRLSYAIRHKADGGSLVVATFLASLRPPDREPPRLATVTKKEEQVIVAVLEHLGFSESSAYQEKALQVLEEYWIPDAT